MNGLLSCEPLSHEELDREVARHQIGMLPEYRKLDGWRRCQVTPQSIRIVHGDFRNEPLRKGRLFGDVMRDVRSRIDRDDFPFAEDIRAAWPDKPPVLVLRTIRNGELYVFDGQKRVLNACYHHEEAMEAFVVDVTEERDVL
jgi:hypothetical protein